MVYSILCWIGHGVEYILPRMNNFDIKQKMAWNISFFVYTQSTKQNQGG